MQRKMQLNLMSKKEFELWRKRNEKLSGEELKTFKSEFNELKKQIRIKKNS